MNFKISKTGIDLIKSFEGCSLKAYRCPAGVWTIGWGTTEPISGVKPKDGMIITQAQADSLLIKNLAAYENAVNTYVTSTINQNQFDALVSFTYNCGCGALKTSTLLKYLNQGNYQEAANQFDLWNKGGGKVLAGLVRRRKAEKELFLIPAKIILQEDTELVKAVTKLIGAGVKINDSSWNCVAKMKLEYAQSLVEKIGAIFGATNYFAAIDALVAKKCINTRSHWDEKNFKSQWVRELIINVSKIIG